MTRRSYRADAGPCQAGLRLHVPGQPTCDDCSRRSAPLHLDGRRRRLCDDCFDRALAELRNLPSGKGLAPK